MPTGNGKTRGTKSNTNVATGLRFVSDRLIVMLKDGREISLPLRLYPTLQHATRTDREQWQIIGSGRGFHWAKLDLDLSTEGLVQGLREAIPRPSAMKRTASPLMRRKAG